MSLAPHSPFPHICIIRIPASPFCCAGSCPCAFEKWSRAFCENSARKRSCLHLRSLSPRPTDRQGLLQDRQELVRLARSPCPASSRSHRLCTARHPDRPLLRPRPRTPPVSRGGSCDACRGTCGSHWLFGSTPDCVQALQPRQKRGEGEPSTDSFRALPLRWGCTRAGENCDKQTQVFRGAQPTASAPIAAGGHADFCSFHSGLSRRTVQPSGAAPRRPAANPKQASRTASPYAGSSASTPQLTRRNSYARLAENGRGQTPEMAERGSRISTSAYCAPPRRHS